MVIFYRREALIAVKNYYIFAIYDFYKIYARW